MSERDGARPAAASAGRHETLASDVSLIASEFLAGFQAVQRIDRPAVSIFGSARVGRGLAGDLRERPRDGAALRRGGVRRRDRWGPRRDGGGEPRRPGGRRALGRVQHRAAARAGRKPVLRHRADVQALLRAQDDVREGGRGVRHLPRRVRHARRALRVADADPDREDRHLSRRAVRQRLLGARCSTGCATADARGRARLAADLELLTSPTILPKPSAASSRATGCGVAEGTA